jgi:S-DNA-T family DNA segregation ATPase FtsK/SpoIIIE
VEASGALSLEGPQPALRSPVEGAVLDTAEPALFEQIARSLAPLRLSGEREQVLSRTVSLPAMLDCPDLAELDPRKSWLKPDDEQLLRPRAARPDRRRHRFRQERAAARSGHRTDDASLA